MLKFLTHKLRTQSLNEEQPYQYKAEDDHDSGTESDDEHGDPEDPESSKYNFFYGIEASVSLLLLFLVLCLCRACGLPPRVRGAGSLPRPRPSVHPLPIPPSPSRSGTLSLGDPLFARNMRVHYKGQLISRTNAYPLEK
ncbi:hypothetical protein J437_LFUL007006, partial [Ladona fulva]